MANHEQVNRLLQGVEGWNTWREEHPTDIIDLISADLRGANLRGANLISANLISADLRGANLNRANLSLANLRGANLISADFILANLRGAHLNGADFMLANLSDANLRGAHFSDAHLSNADLSNADLIGADLSNANLIGADLIGAHFTHTNIGGTSFGDRDLRVVKGLETVHHRGPSPLSINTIYLSQGDLPEAFVRGTGTPDSFLEYMKALTNKPIEYYSCFISYSSKDEAFARRLYDNLQGQNVRCWFAPHDMRIGDEIRSRIDESIRMHDKLLLVLSQHSIESTWVKKEVETAFEKEQQHGKLVLFPVKLDETVMLTEQAWAADIRRMRHIGDFQRWKDHDEYEQAFTRLLRDLKAESNS